MKIIVDVMGGDNAPREIVLGALRAADEFSVNLILVGDEPTIKKIMAEKPPKNPKNIEIVHTTEVVTMEDDPSGVIRQKKDSSLVVALKLLGEGKGDGMVCAGNTGAMLAGSTLLVKRIRGIRRAALAPVLPTAKGGALLVDCGANVHCTPEYLVQFAFMGYFYARKHMNIENPRVALINNGAEETKGTDMLRETYALLKQAGDAGKINFIGNIEGRDIPQGAADVLVCDGFTGNVVLKTIEGVGQYFSAQIKGIFYKNLKTKIAALLVKDGIADFKKSMDYKEVGGAPLLGISKPVIKAHGSSDAYAVRSAIKQAMIYIDSKIIDDIASAIDTMSPAVSDGSKEINN